MLSDKKSYPRPVMAVLVRSKTISGMQKQMASPRIRMMAEANKEVKIILYFFSLRDVKLRKQKIIGYYWHKKENRWLSKDFLFPNVLYIRVGIGKRYTRTYKKLCSIITKKNGKLITHDRFNKWRLYQILSKDPVLKNYLPVTRTVKKSDDIKKMLQRYKVAYLKSHYGKKGENVLRVEVLPDGGYRYSYYRNNQLTVRRVSDFQALMDVVKKFFKDKKFLFQQGIRLLKIKNGFVDMRAELQRNGDGSLDIVGISVRHGSPGSPITTHGDALRFDDFFVKYMVLSKDQLKKFRPAVQKFLFRVYEYLDNNYGNFAEIGIDFAIDTNNKIWFIEANSQSTHVSLRNAYGEAAFYRYNKNILEYARYLSNTFKRDELA